MGAGSGVSSALVARAEEPLQIRGAARSARTDSTAWAWLRPEYRERSSDVAAGGVLLPSPGDRGAQRLQERRIGERGAEELARSRIAGLASAWTAAWRSRVSPPGIPQVRAARSARSERANTDLLIDESA